MINSYNPYIIFYFLFFQLFYYFTLRDYNLGFILFIIYNNFNIYYLYYFIFLKKLRKISLKANSYHLITKHYFISYVPIVAVRVRGAPRLYSLLCLCACGAIPAYISNNIFISYSSN